MTRHLMLLIALCAGCGVTLAQIGGVGKSVSTWADRCARERATAPAVTGPGPICQAAKRCEVAADVVILGETPTIAQLQAAQLLCKVP